MYISPVCTTPTVTSSIQVRASRGSSPKWANGASMSTPTQTCTSAIRCGGVPVSRLAMTEATAQKKAAPSAMAMPSA
ncbi:hypothetical protein D3C71_1959540 [compost metagenome]